MSVTEENTPEALRTDECAAAAVASEAGGESVPVDAPPQAETPVTSADGGSGEEDPVDAVMAAIAKGLEEEERKKQEDEARRDGWTPAAPRDRSTLPRWLAQLLETIDKSADDIGVLVIGVGAKPGKRLTIFDGGTSSGISAAVDATEIEAGSLQGDNLSIHITPQTIGQAAILQRRIFKF